MRLLSVNVVTPPDTLPVTVQEFIDHARLNGITVGNQPDLIERELSAATRRAEKYLRRAIMTQTLAGLFVPDGAACDNRLVLPRGNAQSVVSIESGGAVVDPATYALRWNVITADAAFYAPAEVVWVAGYGDSAAAVPENIREGILEYAALLYGDREGLREPKYASVKAGVPNGIADLWRPDQIEVSG